MNSTIYSVKPRDKDSAVLYRSFREIVKYSRVPGGIVLWKRVYCAWNEALAAGSEFYKIRWGNVLPRDASTFTPTEYSFLYETLWWFSLYYITAELPNYRAFFARTVFDIIIYIHT